MKKKKNEEKDDTEIPEHFKNLSEFLFFGDEKDYLRHYKRTCKNIHNFFTNFFLEERQTIKKGVGRNYDITVSEIRMNRACTIVYVWFEVPKLDLEILDQKSIDEKENFMKNKNNNLENDYNDENSQKNVMEELTKKIKEGKNNELAEVKKSEKLINLENIYKKVELNINKAIPYIKARLTKEIGLKYAPDIRLKKDEFSKEFHSFEDNLENMNHPNSEGSKKKLNNFYFDDSTQKFLFSLYYLVNENKEYILEYFDQIQEGKIDKNTLFPFTDDNTKNISYEGLLEFSEIFSLNSYNPTQYLDKLLINSNYSKIKLEKYLEILRSAVIFTEEEIEKYYSMAIEKKKVITLESVKDNKPLKNYLKKNKITYEEMHNLKEDINKKEAINTFLSNFDYKIPGVKSHVVSFSQLDEDGKKNTNKENKIQKELKNISRKEYKKIKEIAKGGKSKSQKFWDDLEKNYK